MARPKKVVEPENEGPTNQDILSVFLKDNEIDHLNFVDQKYYQVSLGSLKLDDATSGGLTPGMHNFCGFTEGGKTSESLEVIANLFKTVKKNCKAVFIDAEGKLSEVMKVRCGLKFVYNSKDWVDGTIFVFKCNIFETVCSLIERLITDNAQETIYGFIIDSMDAMMLKADKDTKSYQDAVKVAGGALMTSLFCKRINQQMCVHGHICIMLSQVRSTIKIDPYSKEAPRLTSGSGGNALYHYCNFVLQFEARYGGDLICLNPDEKHSDKNPIIGHHARVNIRKSTNESSGRLVKYPIKFKVAGGSSIWIEREIADMLVAKEFLKKKGGWFELAPSFLKELQDIEPTIKEKYQGFYKIYDLISKHPAVKEYCHTKLKEILKLESGIDAPADGSDPLETTTTEEV